MVEAQLPVADFSSLEVFGWWWVELMVELLAHEHFVVEHSLLMLSRCLDLSHDRAFPVLMLVVQAD